jgi:hypothetical protein
LLVGLLLFGGSLPAGAAPIVNGDFETGTFTGWGVCCGAAVVPFDVDGDSQSSLAAQFQASSSTYMLQQNFLITQSGSLQIDVDIAVLASVADVRGGLFRLVVDGSVLDSHDFGSVAAGVPERDALQFSTPGFAIGAHVLRIEITRFPSSDSGPLQYVDDVVFSGSAVAPEPATALLVCAVGVVIARRSIQRARVTRASRR